MLPLIPACSGPGAGLAIRISVIIGEFHAAIAAVTLLALAYDYLRTRQMRFTLPLAAFLLLIHPAWTNNARGGDCGYALRLESRIVTAVDLGLLVFQYVASRWKLPKLRLRRRKPNTRWARERGLPQLLPPFSEDHR